MEKDSKTFILVKIALVELCIQHTLFLGIFNLAGVNWKNIPQPKPNLKPKLPGVNNSRFQKIPPMFCSGCKYLAPDCKHSIQVLYMSCRYGPRVQRVQRPEEPVGRLNSAEVTRQYLLNIHRLGHRNLEMKSYRYLYEDCFYLDVFAMSVTKNIKISLN